MHGSENFHCKIHTVEVKYFFPGNLSFRSVLAVVILLKRRNVHKTARLLIAWDTLSQLPDVSALTHPC